MERLLGGQETGESRIVLILRELKCFVLITIYKC
jgi:hypothetical protein